MPRQFQGELDLSVMVGLMPDHVLEKKDWMVVVEIHLLSGCKPAFHRISNRSGALIQHLLDAARITFCAPLIFRHLCREFGSIFLHENQTHIMNVKSCAMDGLPSMAL